MCRHTVGIILANSPIEMKTDSVPSHVKIVPQSSPADPPLHNGENQVIEGRGAACHTSGGRDQDCCNVPLAST